MSYKQSFIVSPQTLRGATGQKTDVAFVHVLFIVPVIRDCFESKPPIVSNPTFMFCAIYLKCNTNANLCCICGVSTLSMLLVTRVTSLVNGKKLTIQMQHK